MPYQPTAAELHDAFRASRLWTAGITFAQAIAAPEVMAGLVCQVRAERARQAQKQGKPAPVQPALFEERT